MLVRISSASYLHVQAARCCHHPIHNVELQLSLWSWVPCQQAALKQTRRVLMLACMLTGKGTGSRSAGKQSYCQCFLRGKHNVLLLQSRAQLMAHHHAHKVYSAAGIIAPPASCVCLLRLPAAAMKVATVMGAAMGVESLPWQPIRQRPWKFRR